MRRHRLIPLFFAFASAPVSGAAAQWQSSLDAGMSRLTQGTLPRANAATIGGAANFLAERFAIRASALGSRATDERWTGQWVGAGSVVSPSWNALSVQATGTAGTFAQSNELPTTSADFVAQARVADFVRGLAVGGGAGSVRRGSTSAPFSRAVADAWWSPGQERFSVEASLVRTRALFSSTAVSALTASSDFADFVASWQHDGDSYTLTGAGGLRRRSGSASSSWSSVDAALWLSSRVAVVAAVGSTLADVVRGVPSARYATLAMRVSSSEHLPIFHRTPAGARVLVSRLSAGTVRIDVAGVRASRVEIMGDITDWNPVALQAAGSVWRLEQPIAPGLHRIAVRVDGGEWQVPRNLPRADDELGGPAGLLSVP